MALVTTSITLSSAVTLITASSYMASGSVNDPIPVTVANLSTAQVCYWGGSDMTTARLGIPIPVGFWATFSLYAADPIYGITSGGNVVCSIVYGRQKGAAV